MPRLTKQPEKLMPCLLTQQESKGESDVDLTELWRLGTHTLQVRIRSNSYKFQSHALIERHDGTKWHLLYSIKPAAMQTPEGLCYRRDDTASAFDADRATLLRNAELILGVK